MRVKPRVWIGLAIWVGYVIVISSWQQFSEVAYGDIDESPGTLLRGAVTSLVIGSVLAAIATWALGWWRPALFEHRRSAHRWPIVAPLLLAGAAVWNMANTDFAKLSVDYLVALAALGLAVGFAEELVTRGLLLTALRGQLSEVWVWLISSAAFAAMHLGNVLGGQGVGVTLTQVAVTFCAGTSLYILRRVTGSLLPAMALHGLWDFSTFAVSHAPGGANGGMLSNVSYLVALVSVAWVIKGANEGRWLAISRTPDPRVG